MILLCYGLLRTCWQHSTRVVSSLYTGNNEIVEPYLNALSVSWYHTDSGLLHPYWATITSLSSRFWVTPFFWVGWWGNSHCQSSTIISLLVNSDLENKFQKETQFQLLLLLLKYLIHLSIYFIIPINLLHIHNAFNYFHLSKLANSIVREPALS